MRRKGVGKGQGQGYKNIQQWDSSIHSQSAKGIKQPQRISGNIDAFAEQLEPKNNKKFREVYEALKKKEKSFVKKVKEKYSEFQEAQKQKKIQELKDVKHPTIKKMSAQNDRVDELKRQVSAEDDESEIKKLKKELNREEEQLRNLQEEVTEIDLADFSDSELKTLAIRHQSGFSLFGSGNRYQDELVRRVEAKKRLEKSLSEARKKLVDSDSELKTLAIRHQSGFSLFGSGNRYQDELVRRIEAKKRLEKSLSEARKKPVEKGLF